MDISAYTKKSDSAGRKSRIIASEKKCLECGRKLERENNYLYFQSFCCEGCKERYVNSAL